MTPNAELPQHYQQIPIATSSTSAASFNCHFVGLTPLAALDMSSLGMLAVTALKPDNYNPKRPGVGD